MFFDPTSRLVQVDAPILVLYGDRDDHVPVDDCIAALRDLHKAQLTVEVFEGVGHFLTYDDDRETGRLHHEYVTRLVNWLRMVAEEGVP